MASSSVILDTPINKPSRVELSDVGSILRESATAYYKTSKYDGSQWLKDLSGNGHHARLGSSHTAFIYDGALRLPGTAGQNASTPDHADFDVTDLDIRAELTMPDWSPAAESAVISRWDVSNKAYILRIGATTSNLKLYWSNDGTTTLSATSTDVTGFIDGTRHWVRATLDVDNGSGAYEVKFYTSDDGVTWTQLGSTITGGATTSIFAGTSIVQLGETTTVASLNGLVHRTIIKSGIDGTSVFDMDFTDKPNGAAFVTDATGKVVTINGSHAYLNKGLNIGVSSGNYATSPDHADLDITGDIDIRFKAALDTWTPAISSTRFVTKWKDSANQRSFFLALNAAGTLTFIWSVDGATSTFRTSTVAVSFTPGQVGWVRVTLDVDDGAGNHVVRFYTSTDGTTWTQLGADVVTAGTTSIFNSNQDLRIGDEVGGQNPVGIVQRMVVKSGIDGTTVFDADFTAHDFKEFFTEATGKHVAIVKSSGDTNEPVPLRFHPRLQRVYFPGNVDHIEATVPTGLRNKNAGTVEFRARVAPASLTSMALMGGSMSSTPTIHFLNTEHWSYVWRSSGLQRSVDSGAPIPGWQGWHSGQPVWVSTIHDLDADTVAFRYSFDDTDDHTAVSWTTWATVATTNEAYFDITDTTMNIGARNSSGLSPWIGDMYAVARLIDGVVDVNPDFTNTTQWAAPFVIGTDARGNVWTVTRSASGRKLAFVDEDKFLTGTDDYLVVPHHPDLNFDGDDDFTLVGVVRLYGDPGVAAMIFAKRTTGNGWQMYFYNSSRNFRLDLMGPAGTNVRQSTIGVDAGVLSKLTARRDAGTDIKLYIDGTERGATADHGHDTTNTVDLGIGSRGSGNYFEGEIVALAVVRKLLTQSEIITIGEELISP